MLRARNLAVDTRTLEGVTRGELVRRPDVEIAVAAAVVPDDIFLVDAIPMISTCYCLEVRDIVAMVEDTTNELN